MYGQLVTDMTLSPKNHQSRVFDETTGVDQQQLTQFISHQQQIAAELQTPDHRITDKVLGSFIATQVAEPFGCNELFISSINNRGVRQRLRKWVSSAI